MAEHYRVTFCRGTEIRFHEKPPTNVLEYLKSQGFRWSQRDQCWRDPGATRDRFFAELDHELDPSQPIAPDAPCWICKDPRGFFRAYGAATPVYCDACHETTKRS